VRIYAILAHPNPNSLNAHIFNTVIDHLEKQGATVDILRLYDRKDEIPFFLPAQDQVGTKQTEKQYAFWHENRQRFMAADRLFIVHPVYWYAVPGILKCWVDLIGPYAYDYKGLAHAQALHKITKALVVNTAGMPWWYRRFFTKNSATAMMKETFKFIDIKRFDFYEINSVDKLTPALVEKHLSSIMKLANALLH